VGGREGRKEGEREGGRECPHIWIGVEDELEILEEDVHDKKHGCEDDQYRL